MRLRKFNPKLTIAKYMAQIKFNSLSSNERIVYANLRTGTVSDVAVVTGLDLPTEVFLDLTDEHRQEGRTWLARIGKRWVTVYNAGIGMPSWECALTALHLGGAKKIIRVGVGNTLNPEIQIGDLFVPTAAHIMDEVSRKYTTQTRIDMKGEILDFVKEEAPRITPPEVKIHYGTVTSCNYLFAQTKEELRQWSQFADFVDLESALVAAFCAAKGMEGMAILIASDDKLHDKDLFTMVDFPMAKLFENGDFLQRALVQGIRDFNAPERRRRREGVQHTK